MKNIFCLWHNSRVQLTAIFVTFLCSQTFFSFGQTTVVGSPSGSFSVSPTGGAQYDISIEAPKGLGKIQPNIGISYNSQGVMGIIGYGCNISGISVITRGARDIYHDGAAKGIIHTINDAWYIDGKRLLLSSGTEGTPYSVYTIEGDPFTEVTLCGTSSDYWFEVHTSDGMYYQYGKISGARQTYTFNGETRTNAWYINRSEDAQGNYMTYSYTTDQLFIYPSMISYGMNKNSYSGLTNYVWFEYENIGSSSFPFYIEGNAGRQNKLLKSITTRTGNTVFRKYKFTYDRNSDGSKMKFPRLTKVEEENGNGEKLKPIEIEWENIPNFSLVSQDVDLTLPAYTDTIHKRDFFCADVTGDGLSDILEKVAVLDHLYLNVYRCLPDYNNTGQIRFSQKISYMVSPYYQLNMDWSWDSPYTSPQSADLDGDGINDLVLIGYSELDSIGVMIHYGSALDFNTGFKEFKLKTEYARHQPLYAVDDFDGDGLADIMIVESDNGRCSFIHGNTNQNSAPDVTISNLSFSGTPKSMFTGDYDGDGLQDIMLLYDDGYMIFKNACGMNTTPRFPFDSSHRIVMGNIGHVPNIAQGDFNGDGLPDLLLNSTGNPNFYFAICKGNGTFEKTLAYTSNMYDETNDQDSYHFTTFVNDFDGDGLSDVLISKSLFNNNYVNTPVLWLRSNGSSLVFERQVQVPWIDDGKWSNLLTGNFDKSGETCLINYGNNLYTGNTGNSQLSFHCYHNPNYISDCGKAVSFKDGFGKETTVEYSTLLNHNLYSMGTGNFFPLYSRPLNIPVASSVTSSNGAAGEYTESYAYTGLRIHLQGRGIIGFQSISKSNNMLNSLEESKVDSLNYTYYIPSKTTLTRTIGNETMSEENSYEIVAKSGGNYFSYSKRVKATDYDGNLTTLIHSYNTAYGYPLSEKTVYDTHGKFRQTEYSGYVKKGGVWLPTLITSTSRTSSTVSPFVTTESFSYTSTGLPETVIKNSHSSLALTTRYTYDAWGNMLTSVSSGSGVNPVKTFKVYDSTHRFVTQSYTTPASFVNTYTHDIWGNVLTESDETNSSDPLTVQRSYDGWGRLLSQTSPEGITTTYTTGWGTTAGKCYYTKEEPTGRPWTKTWYDECGRKVEVETVGTMNTTVKEVFAYNSQGLVTSKQSQQGNLTLTSSYTYDGRGRLVLETDPTGNSTNYSYGNRRITETRGNRTDIRVYDAWGNIISSSDPVTEVNISYHSCGKVSASGIYRSGGQSMSYDDVGNQISLTDADAGTITYEYNALGNITRQTDARGKVTVVEYDALNRLVKRTIDGTEQSFTYGTTGNAVMRLTSESMNGYSLNYIYDRYGRVTQEQRCLTPYQQYVFSNEYDSLGNLSKRTYPGNVEIRYLYDSYGNKTEMWLGTNKRLWRLESYNGLVTKEQLGDTLHRKYTLNENGYLYKIGIKRGTTSLRNLTHQYNYVTGNLTRRSGAFSTFETYNYDMADRLTYYDPTDHEGFYYAYNLNGNIISKDSVGTYTYNTDWNQPHAVQSVDNTDGLIEPSALTTEYNGFGKVTLIEDFHSMKRHEITYGPDLSRWVSENYTGNSMNSDRTYLGDLEISTYGPGEAVYFYYLDGGVVLRGTGGSQVTPYYLFTDHQGSVLSIYNDNGQKVYNSTYDAWGKQTITKNDIGYYRGYCGHEMLPEFKLINMNGRIYDPVLGRFISPDNYIQDPYNPQSYNRFSYCLNNPVKYNDPSGELFIIDDYLFGGIKGLLNGEGWAHSAERHVDNAIHIWKGLVAVDNNKPFFRRTLDLISRFTWQLPQTALGFYGAHMLNTFAHVDEVRSLYGATAVTLHNWGYFGAATFGCYIIGDANLKADPNNHLFQHEYGHYLQSLDYGLFYLPAIGVPSISHAAFGGDHKFMKYEQDANLRAFKYFNRYVDGFYVSPQDYNPKSGKGWDFNRNPIVSKGEYDSSKDTRNNYVDYYDLDKINMYSNKYKWLW